MFLDIYTDEKYKQQIKHYILTDDNYTDRPSEVIMKSVKDKEKYPIVILDDAKEIVGFFCLHLGKGPEEYNFPNKDYGLIRGFSIDNRYRRQGYVSNCFSKIFDFIHKEIDAKLSHLVLAVNVQNIPAQKAYQKVGFKATKTKVLGEKGYLILMTLSANTCASGTL